MQFFNLNIWFLLIFIPIVTIIGWGIFQWFKNLKHLEKTPWGRLRNFIFSQNRFILKYSALTLTLIFLGMALLRPQWGTETSTVEAEGIDIIIALDVSNSMKALDLSENRQAVSRLSGAKYMLSEFIQTQTSDRFGLVVFSGEAFVSSPLTFDHSAFMTFLNGVSYEDVGKGGTNLSEALVTALARFLEQQPEKDEVNPEAPSRGQALILVSDGGEELTESAENLARKAKESGIKIFTIGIGSTEGAPIPEGQDFFGNIYYKEYQGETIVTKLNEAPLKKIASITGGDYFHAETASDLTDISEVLESIEASPLEKQEGGLKADRYQYFLLPAFLFFSLFLFIRPGQSQTSWQQGKRSALMLLFFLSGCSSADILTRYENYKGAQAFEKAYYSEAEAYFDKAGEDDSEIGIMAQNNKGLTVYKKQNYASARELFESIIKEHCQEKPDELCAQVHYNLGNALYRLGEETEDFQTKMQLWEQAITQYQKTLELNPEDKTAQENIDFIQNQLQQARQEEAQQKQQEKQEGQESEKQKGQPGQKSDSEKSEKGESSESEEGEDGEKSEQSKSESEKSEEEGEAENPYSMSENLEDQVESYMERLERQEKQSQRYLQRNPDAQQNDPNNPFANDPFFDEFFGNPGTNRQRGSGQEVEKDW